MLRLAGVRDPSTMAWLPGRGTSDSMSNATEATRLFPVDANGVMGDEGPARDPTTKNPPASAGVRGRRQSADQWTPYEPPVIHLDPRRDPTTTEGGEGCSRGSQVVRAGRPR